MKSSYDGYIYVLQVMTPIGPVQPWCFVEAEDALAEFSRHVSALSVESVEPDVEQYREDGMYWTDGISAVKLWHVVLIRKDV